MLRTSHFKIMAIAACALFAVWRASAAPQHHEPAGASRPIEVTVLDPVSAPAVFPNDDDLMDVTTALSFENQHQPPVRDGRPEPARLAAAPADGESDVKAEIAPGQALFDKFQRALADAGGFRLNCEIEENPLSSTLGPDRTVRVHLEDEHKCRIEFHFAVWDSIGGVTQQREIPAPPSVVSDGKTVTTILPGDKKSPRRESSEIFERQVRAAFAQGGAACGLLPWLSAPVAKPSDFERRFIVSDIRLLPPEADDGPNVRVLAYRLRDTQPPKAAPFGLHWLGKKGLGKEAKVILRLRADTALPLSREFLFEDTASPVMYVKEDYTLKTAEANPRKDEKEAPGEAAAARRDKQAAQVEAQFLQASEELGKQRLSARRSREKEDAGNWLGTRCAAIIENAGRVETLRLDEDPRENPRAERLANRLVGARGRELPDEQRLRLQRLVLDWNAYDWGDKRQCKPTPIMAFRLHSKLGQAQYVDIVVCFDCRMWGFQCQGDEGVLWQQFGPAAREQLAQLAQEAFPKDAEIQKIWKQRQPKEQTQQQTEVGEAQKLLTAAQEALAQAKSLEFKFATEFRTIGGQHPAAKHGGEILLATKNRARIQFDDTYPIRVPRTFVSSGQQWQAVFPGNTKRAGQTPEHLNRTIADLLVRGGADALVEWLRLRLLPRKPAEYSLAVSNLTMLPPEKINGRKVQVLRYRVLENPEDRIQVTLWLDEDSHLPIRRELVDQRGTRSIFIETYTVKAGMKVDPSHFHLELRPEIQKQQDESKKEQVSKTGVGEWESLEFLLLRLALRKPMLLGAQPPPPLP